MPQATAHQLEVLSTALNAFQCAERADDGSSAGARAIIRTTNVLVDACVACGMPHDLPDHVGWAAERAAKAVFQ